MKNYKFAVIGAGPAGIATVGKLIDQGIAAQSICWIDPAFKVGDFANLWQDVSSNTTVALFEKFYKNCAAFQYQDRPQSFAIETIDPSTTCQLELAAEPLRYITQTLRDVVVSIEDKVTQLKSTESGWQLNLAEHAAINAEKVVLAMGAEPKSLSYPNITEIPLTVALSRKRLQQNVSAQDTVAVFGSSHSAVIIIRDLLELGVKNVINFYQGPLRYAVPMEDWILFDDTGLKGNTAKWAKANLHGSLPSNLQRHLVNDANIAEYLPQCNKAVYPIGFKRRAIEVEGLPLDFSYNPHCGIIAPGLFGVGIAFPEAKYDRFHNLEYRVGLWKFMDYLNNILPIWLKY